MGEFGTVLCETEEKEKFIFGNGISDYVPIMVLLEVMKSAKNTAFLFTVQKRFSGRGLKALLGDYETEAVISVNTLIEKGEVKCGNGPVIIIKEKGAVPTVSLRKERFCAR
jgi:putative aminopeptidase FrvX